MLIWSLVELNQDLFCVAVLVFWFRAWRLIESKWRHRNVTSSVADPLERTLRRTGQQSGCPRQTIGLEVHVIKAVVLRNLRPLLLEWVVLGLEVSLFELGQGLTGARVSWVSLIVRERGRERLFPVVAQQHAH